MGKYMKKPQLSADVTLMDLSPSSTLGVRTRAKTLALQRLNSPPSHPSSSSFYLQLRSRRLEMPPPLLKIARKPQEDENRSEAEKLKCNDSSGVSQSCGGDLVEKRVLLGLQCGAEDLGVEPSFGENCLDFESSGRGTRENTPSNLIRDKTVKTPGSTTRQTSSTRANRRATSNILRNIPTTHEMEEFFSCAEQEQQRLFIEKYNFDVTNDLPLSGRYEWVQVVP